MTKFTAELKRIDVVWFLQSHFQRSQDPIHLQEIKNLKDLLVMGCFWASQEEQDPEELLNILAELLQANE